MKKLILMLCMLLLLCSCVDGATKIGLDRLSWSQSLPSGEGITFSGSAPAVTTDTLYSNNGILEFDGFKVNRSIGTVSVGPYPECDYVTDGVNDEVQILQALDTEKNVYLVGDLHIHNNLTIDGVKNIYGDGPERTVITEHDGASIVFSDIIKTRFSDLEVERDLDGGSNDGTVGINIERCAPFWFSWSIFSNLCVHGSETNLILGQPWPAHIVGPIDIVDCTFGSDPSDYEVLSDRCNVSVSVLYGIEPRFTRCEIFGFNHTGFLVGPYVANNVWISDCYINGYDTAKYGIHIQNGGHLISRVGVEACTEANIYISGGLFVTISDSFSGGNGAIGKTGQALLINSDDDDIENVMISNMQFCFTNGLDGSHSQDSVIEITETAGGSIVGVQFDNCHIWNNGYGAINTTDSSGISIQMCNINDMHAGNDLYAGYSGISVGGAINFMGDSARGSIQNNLIAMSNKGITIQDESWGIMVTGNNIYGTNLGGDAISITTTRPWTITNSTNSWMTW
ncbi:MAG: hypothetical protein WC343_12575 [Bacilli bacterium]|jgi:hypothetical protein